MPKRHPKKAVKKYKSISKPHPLIKWILSPFGLITLVLVGSIFTASQVKVSSSLQSNIQVLGDDDENKQEEKKEEEKKTEETKTQINTFSNANSNSGKSEKTEYKFKKEGTKQESEFESATGQKIKTKAEDKGKAKIEIEEGKLKEENENGEETDVPEDEVEELENEIEDELESEDIDISTDSSGLSIKKNNVQALTNFPLSVDSVTKQLIVTTPAGQKVVTILPDEAVANLLATGIVNKITTSPQLSGPDSTLSGTIKLEEKDGEVVYKVDGVKTHMFLGFIPIETPVTAFVSTETGNPVATEQSLLTTIIDIVSP